MINLQQLNQLALAQGIDIFDGIKVPDNCKVLDVNIVKSACFERCGLCIPIYPDPDTFRAAVTLWSNKNQYAFIHFDNILSTEYDPTENMHETKEINTKFDGTTTKEAATDSNTSRTTGETLTNDTTTLQHGKVQTESGTDSNDTTNSISAYDSGNYQPDNKSENDITYGHTTTDSGTDTTTRNYTKTGTDSTTGGSTSDSLTTADNTEKVIENRHGLIPNQNAANIPDLLKKELDFVTNFAPYDFIARMFENDLTLVIY